MDGLCEDNGIEGVVGARVARLGERADEFIIFADAPSGRTWSARKKRVRAR